MVKISKNANLRFLLDGNEIDAPIEWEDIRVLASFDQENTQANIQTDRFTFVRDGYDFILNYVKQGLNGGTGIFEGIPFEIVAFNINNEYLAFNGFIDLTNEYEVLREQRKVLCRVVKKEGLNNLEKRTAGLTFGYLESIGIINNTDYQNLEYVVEKPVNLFEIINTKIIFYLLIKELANQVRELARDISNATGETAGGVTGAVGAAILASASIVFQAVYAATLLKALIDLAQDMFNSFLSPVRIHKTVNYRVLLEKVAGFLGLELQTDISLLNNLFYLPSNINVDQPNNLGFTNKVGTIEKGIPNQTDFGYKVTDFLSLCKDLFLAKYAIRGGKLLFYPLNSPFWEQDSKYILPDILEPEFRYNTQDLKSNIELTFQTDINDLYTLDNFKGTSFGVNTNPNTVTNTEANFVSGSDSIIFPVALGNRKNELNGLENLLKIVGNTFDDITKVFGGRTNFSNRVKNRVGTLKIEQNNTTVPKTLYLQGGKIPPNERDLFSARVLYNQFHNYKSFIANDFKKQRLIYSGVRVKFSFTDFLQLIENSYFRTQDGKRGKMLKIEWTIAGDSAICDYYIEQPYTKNLNESFIEQQ